MKQFISAESVGLQLAHIQCTLFVTSLSVWLGGDLLVMCGNFHLRGFAIFSWVNAKADHLQVQMSIKFSLSEQVYKPWWRLKTPESVSAMSDPPNPWTSFAPLLKDFRLWRWREPRLLKLMTWNICTILVKPVQYWSGAVQYWTCIMFNTSIKQDACSIIKHASCSMQDRHDACSI